MTFQPTETSLIVMVPILIDNRLEGEEQFTATLSLPAGQVGVMLGANIATVEITDDDCKHFFSHSLHAVGCLATMTTIQTKTPMVNISMTVL